MQYGCQSAEKIEKQKTGGGAAEGWRSLKANARRTGARLRACTRQGLEGLVKGAEAEPSEKIRDGAQTGWRTGIYGKQLGGARFMERSGTPQSPADWRAEQAWTRRPNMKKSKNFMTQCCWKFLWFQEILALRQALSVFPGGAEFLFRFLLSR